MEAVMREEPREADDEIARQRDEVVKRMLATPPQPKRVKKKRN
jgi:hypothetical protein